MTSPVEKLQRNIVQCRVCPRLVRWREKIAHEKVNRYADEEYWGKPIPSFGDPHARLLLVGLAPAAHGGNRTGRMFTGDNSGHRLYRALYKAGFATQAEATSRDDGLQLIDCAITATCHCAPPDNKPLPEEIAACHEWFAATIDAVPVRVFLALGGIGWRSVMDEARSRGWYTGKLPKFAHGAKVALTDNRWLLGSYHPSQQNTFTGRLTEPMFDAIFASAKKILRETKS